jgi:hypothetical protein
VKDLEERLGGFLIRGSKVILNSEKSRLMSLGAILPRVSSCQDIRSPISSPELSLEVSEITQIKEANEADAEEYDSGVGWCCGEKSLV